MIDLYPKFLSYCIGVCLHRVPPRVVGYMTPGGLRVCHLPIRPA